MGIGKSEADAFYMPAFGYVKKQGNLAYGAGIYGQGGMGTEYANGDMAQVGVGRVIFPLAYCVNDRFNIGGSVDIVWAGMDLVASCRPASISRMTAISPAQPRATAWRQAGLHLQAERCVYRGRRLSDGRQPARSQG